MLFDPMMMINVYSTSVLSKGRTSKPKISLSIDAPYHGPCFRTITSGMFNRYHLHTIKQAIMFPIYAVIMPSTAYIA